MLMTYLTIDQVNLDLARQLAVQWGAALEPQEPRDLPAAPPDVMLYDLDCLPDDLRQRTLAGLLARPVASVVGVHSYGLDDAQVERLARNGVVVTRRLGPALFLLLRAAALPPRDAVRPDPVVAALRGTPPAGPTEEGNGRQAARPEEGREEVLALAAMNRLIL
jgi:hypothetical protein